MIAIHGWAAAGREQHRARLDETQRAGSDVREQHAGERSAVAGWDEGERPMLLQPADARTRPYLLHQPIDDLDAGEITLVDGAVEALAGERLAVQRSIRIAVEEAADLVFEFAHPLDRARHQRPGEFLVRQPLAALDGVHEMALDRVTLVQRHVVAALNHAGAAAFAEQPFGGHHNGEVGIGALGMQRRKQAGAAGAEDQDIGGRAFDRHGAALYGVSETRTTFPIPLATRVLRVSEMTLVSRR